MSVSRLNAQITKHELNGTLRAVGSGARNIYFGIGEDGLLYIYVNGKKTGEGIDTGIRISQETDAHGGIIYNIEAPQPEGHGGSQSGEATDAVISKVTMNGATLIDVTQDTVTADTMFSGIVATGASGAKVNGAILDGDAMAFGDRADPRVNLGQTDYLIVVDGAGIEPLVGVGLCDVAVLVR